MRILSDRDIYEIQSSFIHGKSFQEHPGNYPRLSASVLIFHPESRSVLLFPKGAEEILIPDTETPILKMETLTDICQNDIKMLHKLPDKFYNKVVLSGLIQENHLRTLLGVMLVAEEKFVTSAGIWSPYQILEIRQTRFPWDEAIYHLDRLQGGI